MPTRYLKAWPYAPALLNAEQGFLYLCGEYLHLVEKLQDILEQRRDSGLLGNNILDQGLNFDIEIRLGCGAYICGEESALIESLEGKCGIPRNRPPYPFSQGYLGKPTVVNNVETFFANREIDASHPDILIDQNRCIFCNLCVRASQEKDRKNVFAISGRGINKHLIVNSISGELKDSDSDIDIADHAVHICPTGAILIKRTGYQVAIGERMIEWAQHIEFDRSPITDIEHCGPCDIGLIEGGVCNSDNYSGPRF